MRPHVIDARPLIAGDLEITCATTVITYEMDGERKRVINAISMVPPVENLQHARELVIVDLNIPTPNSNARSATLTSRAIARQIRNEIEAIRSERGLNLKDAVATWKLEEDGANRNRCCFCGHPKKGHPKKSGGGHDHRTFIPARGRAAGIQHQEEE